MTYSELAALITFYDSPIHRQQKDFAEWLEPIRAACKAYRVEVPAWAVEGAL